MKKVWKYPITATGHPFSLTIPKGAAPLSVQIQHGEPVIWFEVEPEEPAEERRFVVVGTGYELPKEAWCYYGTFQLYNGHLVLHLYELEEYCP